VESPIDVGPAEIRYMSGQGAKVLARRALQTVPAQITLQGPAQAMVGTTVSVDWTGPKNPGDFLTVVLKSAKDGTSFATAPATGGSPARLLVPPEAGAAEIRYMSGQGNRTLARAPIELLPVN
jgi:Ca-activated chloride channel family protein